MRDTMGLRADETATLMLAKWSTTLYGFVKSGLRASGADDMLDDFTLTH
jgi:hypothetical protein